MRKTTTLGLTLGFAVAFAGTAAAQIKMGVAGPITGPSASSGAQLKNGTDMAAADVNAAGGILGQKIVLSYGDDASDPKQGVSVANKFAGDGIKFIVGHYNSGVTMPSSEVYQENGMLEITPSATNPKITERGMWNIFRTCGRDDQQGAVAAAYIVQHFKGKKIAIVHDKTTYGQGLADETKKAMTKGGMKEALYEGVNLGEKDFSALVSKIKASGSNFLARNFSTTALASARLRGSGGKVIRVPSTPGPPTVANSSEVMPSPPISTALTPWSRIWRTTKPPSVCRPPQ